MGKSHRTAKAKSQKPRRRPARASTGLSVEASSSSARSGSRSSDPSFGGLSALAVPELAAHQEPFLQWMVDGAYATSEGDADADAAAAANAPVLWMALQVLCTLAVSQGLSGDPAHWTVAEFERVVDLVRTTFPPDAETVAEGDPTAAEALIEALLMYMTFVQATGRWPGRRLELAGVLAHLTMAVEPDGKLAQLTAGIRTGAQVDEATEDAAVLALPLVADIVEMLRVTDRRRQAELAGEVGEDDGPVLEEAMTALTGADDDPLAVRHLWLAAQFAKLVEVDGSAATLTPAGRTLAAGPEAAMDDTRRVVLAWLVASATLSEVMTGDARLLADLGGRAPSVVLPALATGLSGRPLSTAQVDAAMDTLTDVPPEHRDAVRASLRALVGRVVRSGLLRHEDGHYVVPVGLESLVVGALEVVTSAREAHQAAHGAEATAARRRQ